MQERCNQAEDKVRQLRSTNQDLEQDKQNLSSKVDQLSVAKTRLEKLVAKAAKSKNPDEIANELELIL